MSKVKYISFILIAVLLCVTLLCGCVEKPSDYTLEEHIERITPRIEKRYINEETRDNKYSFITDYKLYPLYNYQDELLYFLIEFEPYGFAFVGLFDTGGYYNEMYRRDDGYIFISWQRYRVCIDGVEPTTYQGRQWLAKENDSNQNYRYEVDDNGKFIEYNHSPYLIANVLSEKLYILDLYHGSVPAIKQDGKFINLVSMEEFNCEGDWQYYKELDKQSGYQYVNNTPKIYMSFIIKSEFYL